MVVAHDAGDFPSAGLLLPDHHELGITAVFAAVLDVAKPLRGDVYSPVALDGKHFQAARHQRAADVGALGKQPCEARFGLAEIAQAAFVVEKLQVRGEVGHELIHVMGIEGGKHFRVEFRHLLIQLILGGRQWG